MPSLISPAVAAGALRDQAQPTILVDELVVRPWQRGDSPAVVAAYTAPDIQRWHARSMTAAEARAWVRSWADGWASETAVCWAVADPTGLVGRVGFRMVNLTEGAGEAAYWVVPAARGRAVAARALTAVTNWMFEQVGLHRTTLLHSARNPASCRVAARASYLFEGTLRKQGLHADGWHDMHLHARLRDA